MRLIDADALKNEMCENCLDKSKYDRQFCPCERALAIDHAPAAYDVDRVINKIEERIDCSTYYIDDDDKYNFGMEFAYKDCIGIVRKGAK